MLIFFQFIQLHIITYRIQFSEKKIDQETAPPLRCDWFTANPNSTPWHYSIFLPNFCRTLQDVLEYIQVYENQIFSEKFEHELRAFSEDFRKSRHAPRSVTPMTGRRAPIRLGGNSFDDSAAKTQYFLFFKNGFFIIILFQATYFFFQSLCDAPSWFYLFAPSHWSKICTGGSNRMHVSRIRAIIHCGVVQKLPIFMPYTDFSSDFYCV